MARVDGAETVCFFLCDCRNSMLRRIVYIVQKDPYLSFILVAVDWCLPCPAAMIAISNYHPLSFKSQRLRA